MARDTTAATLCDEALRLVDAQPRRAWDRAGQALDMARRAHDPESAAVAERARGLAALHLADLDTALKCERGAVRLARRARNTTLAAEARMTLAYVLSCRGQPGRALAVIDRACADLTGVQRHRAAAQRGAILQQLGRLGEALDTYREVLPRLRAAADWVWTWRVLNNRGVLQIFRHHFTEALHDLREAEALSTREDLGLLAANVQENLGFAHSRRGAVPDALRHFEQAERRYRELGVGVSSLLLDRAELLLSVRLAREAREAAQLAVDELTRTRGGFKLPEGHLMVAAAALLDGDCRSALPAARQAAAAFTRQHRADWSAMARLLGLRCRAALGMTVAVPDLVRTARTLDEAGWRLPALDARVTAARIALDRGRHAEARALLAAAGASRTSGPAELRIRAWHATALLHLLDGHRRSACAAIIAGLRVAEDYRGTLGAADLVAHVSGHRTELVELGLRMALEARSARRVLHWAERGRATHLLLGRGQPPSDPVLDADLARVRQSVADITDARRAGRPVAVLERRRTLLENRVRDHLRRRRGHWTDAPAPASADELAAALDSPALDSPALNGAAPGEAAFDDAAVGGAAPGELAVGGAAPGKASPGELAPGEAGAALVEYAESAGALYALVVVGGRIRLRTLGSSDSLTAVLEHLPFAMRRAATGDARNAEAADRLLTSLGRRLDALLVRPLLPDIGERALVIVPTGSLQSLPWPLLPSCADRPVTISPSATLWLQAARPGRHDSRQPATSHQVAVGALAVAGPDLPGAEAEVAALRELHPDATVLTGQDATVAAVLEALPRAGIAHLAAHGTFRTDNPLFSALRLADGPLTVHDLQTLGRVPEIVILAACDSGRSLVCPGDELLGFSAALLTLGARALVAAMLPVPDGPAAVMMTTVHRRLAAGDSPARALVAARRVMAGGGPAERVAAAGFVCLGAGL